MFIIGHLDLAVWLFVSSEEQVALFENKTTLTPNYSWLQITGSGKCPNTRVVTVFVSVKIIKPLS